jgi:predicted nucleic acid-binding Zn ribbon protein
LRQPFRAPKPEQCPAEGCDGEVTKVITPPAIVFKGPGFHVNDYGRSGGNGKKREEAEKAEKAEKADVAPKPSKPAAETAKAAVGED